MRRIDKKIGINVTNGFGLVAFMPILNLKKT